MKTLRTILLIIGIILLTDAVILIAQKKVHLGTILPLLIGLGLICYYFFYIQIQKIFLIHPKLIIFWKMSWMLFTVWVISLLGFFSFLQYKTHKHSEIIPVKAIIVLGSGVIQGKASPTLAARLDSAAQVSIQQPQALIIVSGGLDYGEKDTEAEIMSKYLQQHYQISSSNIALEQHSTSTALNLENSQAILQQNGLTLDSPIAIVTSDFHTLRAAAIAKKQGYQQSIMVSATTPLATRYNAWLREYFAYLSGWILKEY